VEEMKMMSSKLFKLAEIGKERRSRLLLIEMGHYKQQDYFQCYFNLPLYTKPEILREKIEYTILCVQ
jgi:hypothetical protein